MLRLSFSHIMTNCAYPRMNQGLAPVRWCTLLRTHLNNPQGREAECCDGLYIAALLRASISSSIEP